MNSSGLPFFLLSLIPLSSCRLTRQALGGGVRHDKAPLDSASKEALHYRPLPPYALTILHFGDQPACSGACFAQSDMPAADSSSLDFKQWGLLAIQDGGRRKPIDTFARETLIKTTGRSSYTDTRGKKWQAKRFRSLGPARHAQLEGRTDGAGVAGQ